MRRWVALPSMREAKEGFNPCEWRDSVYLCGYRSLAIEVLSLQTDQFLHIQLSIPESESCCLYVHNSLLVVHTFQHIYKFAGPQGGHLLLHSQTETRTGTNKCPNSRPVVDCGRGVFFYYQWDKCLCVDMESGELVQRFPYGSTSWEI